MSIKSDQEAFDSHQNNDGVIVLNIIKHPSSHEIYQAVFDLAVAYEIKFNLGYNGITKIKQYLPINKLYECIQFAFYDKLLVEIDNKPILIDGLKASPLNSTSGFKPLRCCIAVLNLEAPPTGS